MVQHSPKSGAFLHELNSLSTVAFIPKAVFAVTSQGNDIYTAMTRIVVASLRLTNPRISLVVACDPDTDCAIRHIRDPLIDEVDEWITVDTPPGDAHFRNRFVKTSLRAVIDGPFLFLDSDVLVRGDLSELFALDTDIAGARNHSRMPLAEQVWDQDVAAIEAMGWQTDNKVYVNGGVLFLNNTPSTYRFSSDWHQRWLESSDKLARHRDQPALNTALQHTQPRLMVLPDRFNAQFRVTPSVAHNAVIWHYYSSSENVAHTTFELLTAELVRGAKLDYGRIAAMIEKQHPWRCDSRIDDWAAAGIIRRGQFDGWESAWLLREMRGYLSHRLRDEWRRVRRAFGLSSRRRHD